LAIPHVEYGKEADPDHQNSIIDATNLLVTQVSALAVDVATLQTEILAKAELCSDLPEDTSHTSAVGSSDKASPCDHVHKGVGSAEPQDIASAASAGAQPLASREDHKHKGVSKIVAGTNITIDPATGVGAVTVTAAAAAGGVTKVEKTFDGTFAEGEELCSDTPATDKLPVAIYFELTTTDGGLYVSLYLNEKTIGLAGIMAAGDYGYCNLITAITFDALDNGIAFGSITHGWKLGYKISLKTADPGTGSGKLIIYYATIT
jgi:hypothetical protein